LIVSTVYNRRLPVYVILDCSESLVGQPIQAIAEGMAALLSDLRGDPMALETVHLAVITFSTRAQFALPLTELLKVQVPKLKMGTGTALGAALKLFLACLDHDIVKSTATQKGDWKPYCLILTDGEPTDEWLAAASKVKNEVCGRRANVVAIGCGDEANTNTLKQITETVLKATDVRPGTLKALFKWVSSSVSTASHRLETAGGNAIALPPLPEGSLKQVSSDHSYGLSVEDERRVFLHSRCIKNKQFYIMRFHKRGKLYQPDGSFPVDDFDFGDDEGRGGSQISVRNLGAPPPCPVCDNEAISFCECGRMFCSPMLSRPTTQRCPWCGKQGQYGGGGGEFDVGRGRG
jgi:uncharacterized protein YegL